MRRTFFFCLLSAIAFLAACHSSKSGPPGPSVSTVTLKYENVPILKTYIGITQSIASVDIRARVEGFLTEMAFIEGKPVTKGQKLFVIDQKPFQAQLDLAEGNLIRSIAQVEYQKVQYERMKILVAKDDISRSHYDEVHARYKEAVGEVQVQKAQVEKAQINLGYCTMLAPFDAIIGKKYVDVGNLVGSGESTLLAQVVQMNPMYVIFNPSVADYEEMFSYIQNQPFSIQASLPMGNATFTGTLNLINNVVDQGTSTVMMRATVENPKLFLLPGVFVNVTMQLGQNPKTILVPTKAIMDLQGQSMVYVVDKNSVISSRIIQISGEYKTSTIIKSGLQVGDKVVISGLQKLRPGQKVVAVSA